MLLFIIAEIFLVGLTLSMGDERVVIARSKVHEIDTPNYPEVYSGGQALSWEFEAEGDAKLQVKCDDFRLSESENCSAIRMIIEDGDNKQEFCGYQEMLKYVSTSNRLGIRIEGHEGEAVISCFIKNMELPEPEVVELTLNKLTFIQEPTKVTPYFDKVWHLKAPEGLQCELKCYINLLEMQPCYEEILSIDLGDGIQEYCGTQQQQLFSIGNEATVRLELGSNGVGSVHCVAQAAIKSEELVENTVRSLPVPEEDSSEHGGAEGPRGTTCPCGWSNKPRARIIRGREASPNEYPWIVAVKAYFGEANINCGGSIITSRHVVTAAHCLVNMYVDMSTVKPEDLFVTVGVHDLEKMTPKGSIRKYQALRHFIRPEFLKEYTHDIAIIVLNDKIEFSKNVGPICLSPHRIAEPSQPITILGWGKTESGKTSSILLKAKTTVVEQRHCDINKFEICTRADKSATCTGDSGGPLSWLDPETNRYTLMSLVSYGDPDCVSTPSVSTDIAFFYDWIQKIIKSTFPDKTTCIKQ